LLVGEVVAVLVEPGLLVALVPDDPPPLPPHPDSASTAAVASSIFLMLSTPVKFVDARSVIGLSSIIYH